MAIETDGKIVSVEGLLLKGIFNALIYHPSASSIIWSELLLN